MANITPLNLAISLSGGILPALLWLWFWLQEDKLHPEPRGRILLAFWGGMLAVPFVFPLEKITLGYFGMSSLTFFLWAFFEEGFKFLMAYITALRSKACDEPIDALEYMITTALGFAALENTLFILNPLLQGQAYQGLVTGNMRFIGASLLHVIASAFLGYCIGREFYRPLKWKIAWRIFGLVSAVALHTVFNAFIMYKNGSETFAVFTGVWMGVIGVLLLFEKIKQQKN